jgi:two-component system, NarL family, invasion response regulator UvrY
MIRVLIVDDHAVVRRGLRQIIEEASGVEVAGEASEAADAIDSIHAGGFNIVLLDISMPGRNGFDVLSQIRQSLQKVPVLVLSMHPEDQYGLRALKAGASGYLTKESAPAELVAAIRKVADGGKYLSESLAEKILESIIELDGKAPHELLSNREFQVLCMLAQGKTVKGIATEVSLSEKTISTYRTRILEKMNMATNAELTYYAISNHLVQ